MLSFLVDIRCGIFLHTSRIMLSFELPFSFLVNQENAKILRFCILDQHAIIL